MADVNKIPVGSTVRRFPARTFNRLVDGEVRDRARAAAGGTPSGRSHQPVVARLHWKGEDDLPPGHTVKLGDVIFDPTDADNGHAPFAGLQFHCDEFEEGDDLTGYAVTLGPIEAGGIGYGVMPESWWAKVDILDSEHFNAVISSGGTLLETAESGGLRILWKPSETGEHWVVVQIAGSGGGGGSVSIRVALIDKNILGILTADPPELLEAADIELTPEEIEDEYTVQFQNPPDDDLDANPVDWLDLVRIRRREEKLKYFESDPRGHSGTAQAGGANTIQLAVGASTVDGFYVGDDCNTNGGTGSGQSKKIIAYDGDTLTATVESNWSTNPDATTTYDIVSDFNSCLATEIIDDAENHRKIVRYALINVRVYEKEDFVVGTYTRDDYPDYPENTPFPPDGLPEGYLNKRYYGLVINGWLFLRFCGLLPKPPLPE